MLLEAELPLQRVEYRLDPLPERFQGPRPLTHGLAPAGGTGQPDFCLDEFGFEGPTVVALVRHDRLPGKNWCGSGVEDALQCLAFISLRASEREQEAFDLALRGRLGGAPVLLGDAFQFEQCLERVQAGIAS